MKRIAVALVVLVVVGATWWIVGLAEDVTVPSFEAPPVPVAVVPRVDVAPGRVVEQVVVDAGAVVTKPIEVVFDVRRDGVHAIGTRVTVSQGSRSVSGLVNVMGGLTLPLEPGEWVVHGLHLAPSSFMVTSETRSVSLELLTEKRVSGRVVDLQKKPVPHVEVLASDARSVMTDKDGHFSFALLAKSVEVVVEDMRFVSEPKRVEPPADDVELVVEPTLPLRITLGSGVAVAGVNVAHRLGAARQKCHRWCEVLVPSGDYTVVAVSSRNSVLLMARAKGTQGSKGDDQHLVFEVAPPISGVVTNAAGVVMADVPLRLVPAFSVDGFPGETTITKRDGTFVYAPTAAGSSFGRGWHVPSWRLEVMAPWKGTPKYVSFGDAPITLTVESP